jgi:tRNA dimethylallyltransferase
VPGDRERLYAGIARRFAAMLAAGLLEEVRALYLRGDLHDRLPAIRSVGYRQLWEHLQGAADWSAAIDSAVLATRHLARRQLVWLRSESDVRWIDALDPQASAHIEATLATLL